MLNRSNKSFVSCSLNAICGGTKKCSVISTSKLLSLNRSRWKMGSNFLHACFAVLGIRFFTTIMADDMFSFSNCSMILGLNAGYDFYSRIAGAPKLGLSLKMSKQPSFLFDKRFPYK